MKSFLSVFHECGVEIEFLLKYSVWHQSACRVICQVVTSGTDFSICTKPLDTLLSCIPCIWYKCYRDEAEDVILIL